METVFAKIIRKEIPAFIIMEDEKFMAFLDAFPATYAQVVVVPKEWHDSYLFNNDDEFISEFMKYVKKVAKLLDEKLGSERCRILFEGYGVNHLHAKLYPAYGYKPATATEPEEGSFNPRNKVEFNDEIGREILGKIKRDI